MGGKKIKEKKRKNRLDYKDGNQHFPKIQTSNFFFILIRRMTVRFVKSKGRNETLPRIDHGACGQGKSHAVFGSSTLKFYRSINENVLEG